MPRWSAADKLTAQLVALRALEENRTPGDRKLAHTVLGKEVKKEHVLQ